MLPDEAGGAAFGLEHCGLEAKQTQIPQQLGQGLIVERRLGRVYAELNLPSNSDLAFGAGLAETQEADRRFRRIFTQTSDLCGQPLLQFLGGDGSVWMTTDRDLAHTLIVSASGPGGNGCPYPFRFSIRHPQSSGERHAAVLVYTALVGKR